MTKDRDFVELVERYGTPPRVIWLTCGNTSNERLRTILAHTLPHALTMLQAGEAVAEISAQP
jgi:predicted nuclease of predicted toxin-antitoxin system